MDKKYSAPHSEQALQKQWDERKTYTHTNHSGQPFSIDTPPPTVSGSLHIGHIFSYTQTDIIARYSRMSGYSVFYPFGFDDNGLPTEKYVEKKCKVKAHELGRSAFIKLCLEQTKDAEQEFKSLWQRMGLSVDWSYWYSTISESTRRISQLSFLQLYEKGFIYRKNEPALYCTACRTTVAQAELEDIEHPSTFNTIVFEDQDGNELHIGTTRPELLYSCSALLYHPEDKRYAHLKGKQAIVPLYDRTVPIYADEDVAIDKGTGLVMVCTFGDQKDIEWYKKYDLPLLLSIGTDGKWTQETGPFAGLRAKAAREKVLALLQEQNKLREQKPITHAVNVHERCKKEIEYTVICQWFIKILEHKEQFLKLADQITWHPSFMKARFIDWVSNIKWDWCISRQRFYGIPFPAWHCTDCDAILLAPKESLPIDPQETAYPGSCTCGSTNLKPDTDVMDTWNTSSITPYITYNLSNPSENPFDDKALEYLPMGMRPQAHDIIRTWAFYTMVKTWMHNKTIPWKQIVISGHVTFNKAKISKSQGNNPYAPDNLLKQYSADVIRYWSASGTLGHDTAFSDTQLKIGQRLVTKLWNAFKFAQPHLNGYTPQTQPVKLGLVNEWILASASKAFATYQNYFEKHEFGLALNTIERFFWHDFCDNYLELIKHQLFNSDEYTADEVAATKWSLYQAGMRILQLYAPYVPFITEEIYNHIYKQTVGIDSLHQTKFEQFQKPYHSDEAYAMMQQIVAIIGHVRKLKSDNQLSLKTEVALLNLYGVGAKALKPYEKLIKGVSQAKEIAYHNQTLDESSLKTIDNQIQINITI